MTVCIGFLGLRVQGGLHSFDPMSTLVLKAGLPKHCFHLTLVYLEQVRKPAVSRSRGRLQPTSTPAEPCTTQQVESLNHSKRNFSIELRHIPHDTGVGLPRTRRPPPTPTMDPWRRPPRRSARRCHQCGFLIMGKIPRNQDHNPTLQTVLLARLRCRARQIQLTRQLRSPIISSQHAKRIEGLKG